MKCKVKKELTIERLNFPQWMPGEGYSDPLRGDYRKIMEYEFYEVTYGDIKCPVYRLIGVNGIKSCEWAGSVFDNSWEIIN